MTAERRNGLRVGVVTLIAGLVLSQAAIADPHEGDLESITRRIDISGLDLSTQAGAERLFGDIARTARNICMGGMKGQRGVVRARERRDQARRCFDEAVNGALAQVAEQTGIDLERVAKSDRFDYAGLVAWR